LRIASICTVVQFARDAVWWDDAELPHQVYDALHQMSAHVPTSPVEGLKPMTGASVAEREPSSPRRAPALGPVARGLRLQARYRDAREPDVLLQRATTRDFRPGEQRVNVGNPLATAASHPGVSRG